MTAIVLIKAKDIMTRKVISVHPEDSIFEAHKIISKNNFDGVPVVDADNHLAGILTEYDLITKGSSVHLPTLQKVMSNFKIYKKDRGQFKKEIEELQDLKVKDIMNKDPLTLTQEVFFEEVVTTFKDHHRVNPIPIIDDNNKVVGVISRYDVLKSFNIF